MSESIKKKIAALLAKAEGTDNEFEAASFMAKVNELLEKHQVEMHEIRAMGDSDPMGHEAGGFNVYASMTWAKLLAHQLALFYGCSTIWTRRKNNFTYDVIGRESARQTFELMLPFVITQVRRLAKTMVEQTNTTRSIAERDIGQALSLRVHSMVKANDAHRAELASKDLVPVNDVDAYMKENFAFKAGGQRKVKTSMTAREAADKVSLHVQATGKHVKLIK